MVTIVTAIEMGPMESCVELMAESVRKWGGEKLANAKIIAVVPRFGPAISNNVKKKLLNFDVEFVTLKEPSDFSWFDFMNKPKVFKYAEEYVKDEQIIWLDADTLVIAPPNDLILSGENQIAFCSLYKEIASSGPDDTFEQFWQNLGDSIGISADLIPWIYCEDGNKIRGYWNSGIVSFRNGAGIGSAYYDICNRIIRSKVFSKIVGFHYMDQIGLSFLVANLGLKFKNLSKSYNSHILYEKEKYNTKLANNVILHYHEGLWPKKFKSYVSLLDEIRPDVSEWLKSKGPLSNQGGIVARIFLKVLKKLRKMKYQLYLKQGNHF